MKKKSISTLSVVLLIALTLSACSGQPSGTTTPAENTDALTIDNYGREIVIDSVPQQVLALGPNCAELLVALGLEEYIIGTSLRNHSRGPLPEYAAAIEAIPEINHAEATREGAIASGADFIYGIDWEFGSETLDVNELESYGMVTYINAATTLEEQYQEIRDIGRIFGIEDVAELFVADQQARIQAVQDAVSGQEPLKVLVYDSGSDGVFTASGINFESLLVSLAGGENIFGDLTDRAWVTVSYEEVLARKPDIILIHDYDSPSMDAKIAEIKANDALSQLDCVQNDRFAVISLESVLPGNRMAYTVEALFAAFYPELTQQ